MGKHGQELHKRVVQGYDTRREYWSDSALYGPFGTEDGPVYVPSQDNHRFVGCLGGYEGVEEHELVWFLVRQGPKHRCPLCGQIFQLVTSDSSHPDHPLHDPTFNYDSNRHKHAHMFGKETTLGSPPGVTTSNFSTVPPGTNAETMAPLREMR